MLRPEEAQERLKAFRSPDGGRAIQRRLNGLPGSLAELGQMLIHAGPAWERAQKSQSGYGWTRIDVLTPLEKLRPRERESLFKALFPKITDELRATWDLFERLPYQIGHYRRPFRNPDRAAFLRRAAWFHQLALTLRDYDAQDVVWLTGWAPHLGYYGDDVLGYLCAGAIDAGGATGQAVFDTLIASGNGEHETGGMGRHVVRGLLCASRPEGWEYIERLLLAAQREEGLRQVILESIDESHPDAFRRVLRLVVDQNLLRFSSTLRAVDVWFGLALENISPKAINEILRQVLTYFESPEEGLRALRESSAQEAYYALWAMAFRDAQSALPHAIRLRASPDPARRFAATHVLAQMGLAGGFQELLNALDDEDLHMPARVLADLTRSHYDAELLGKSDLFERLERLLLRLPHKQNTLKPLVWDWFVVEIDRQTAAGRLVECLGNRPPLRLVPHLDAMAPNHRALVANLLTREGRPRSAETLEVLLRLAGDPSSQVRGTALQSLKDIKLKPEQVVHLESLLARKVEDLRRGVIRLLLGLPDRELIKSTERLLAQKNESQRLAALELLRECKVNGRLAAEAAALAKRSIERAPASQAEAALLDEILGAELEKVSLEDALGLMDPAKRTRPEPPRGNSGVKLGSAAACACLRSLDELIELHRNDEIEIPRGDAVVKELLGNAHLGMMTSQHHFAAARDDQPRKFPLSEVWEAWWNARDSALRDPDGFELLRALAALALFPPHWLQRQRGGAEVPRELQKHFDVRLDFKLKYQGLVQSVVEWLVSTHAHEAEADFLLSALEESVRRIPAAEISGATKQFGRRERSLSWQKLAYLTIARWRRRARPAAWRAEHHSRFWKVVRWLDQPKPGVQRIFPEVEEAALAFEAGAATRDDLLDLFLGPRGEEGYGYHFSELRQYSGRRAHADFERHPVLKDVLEVCRERIIEVESRRGDLPTAASGPAASIRSVPGLHNLFRLLAALGKRDFERGYLWGQSASAVLSHLIRNSYPLETDTLDDFVGAARAGQVTDRRLVQLAVYAPQWTRFVQHTLGWHKLDEAVWWLYAHTKDRQWTVEQEIRNQWSARISEYTPLAADSLMDGAVDVSWFHNFHSELDPAHWKEIYRAAEYAAGGMGHTRARLFADAMLGKLTVPDCAARIQTKRHQDSARALGLIPLSESGDAKAQVLERYEVMQEFLRTGKKFGSMRQASEKLAVAIGMENLARTAGYADPQRLEWAMEIEAVADLASGQISAQAGDVTVTLSLDELGEPQVAVTKAGKGLKAIPAAVKKDAAIAALVTRKQQLDRQTSRMRLSLEASMCRGDVFLASELRTLFRHPVLRVMAEQLVFVGAARRSRTERGGMGYPIEDGAALQDHTGARVPIAGEAELRIAHPLDFLQGGAWHLWQHECFIAERIQPFKQVFRELYVLTSAEKGEGNLSRRYAGHQVQPRQAIAVFGKRGWVVDPEEGVRKTFHEAGISAHVGFLEGAYTPAEMEGLTLEAVGFTRRGAPALLPLEQVPERIFSEVMRDLDLVVSVAHAGGVDPEASASSIEARAALLRETSELLGLGNVQLSSLHAVVEGKLGSYNVHLGSGVVHKQPGGALCIIPVHAQQRGRLFLPFVDSDPKTAEIVSKVILLARDDQIKDPTILEQIRQ